MPRRFPGSTPLGRRIAYGAVLTTLALAAFACGEDERVAVGFWTLLTVNGSNLPAVLSDDGTTVVRVQRGRITIRDTLCIVDLTYETTVGTSATQENSNVPCSWEQSGGEVSIISSEGELVGTVDEMFMTLTDEDGNDFVYERV